MGWEGEMDEERWEKGMQEQSHGRSHEYISALVTQRLH